jgi:acetyl esterase/lipase
VAEDESILNRGARPPDRVIAYGPDPEQTLEIRDGSTGSARPLVILIHGGFWRPDIDRAHARPMADAIAAAGWTVALPEYARAPGEPERTLADLRQLLSPSATRVTEHNGRVVIVGHSAGGHLALWAAATGICPTLIGTLALAPVADLLLADQLGLGNRAVSRFVGGDPLKYPHLDPCRLPGPSIAIRLLHGVDDEIVPLRVSESYRRAHPASELTALAGAGHFALIDPEAPAWAAVLVGLSGFIA